jgi:hypothetical protein
MDLAISSDAAEEAGGPILFLATRVKRHTPMTWCRLRRCAAFTATTCASWTRWDGSAYCMMMAVAAVAMMRMMMIMITDMLQLYYVIRKQRIRISLLFAPAIMRITIVYFSYVRPWAELHSSSSHSLGSSDLDNHSSFDNDFSGPPPPS